MKSLLRKIFNRENILNLLVVIGGIIVLVNNYFDFLPVAKDEKIIFNLTAILAMLALIGIDGFIERINFLGRIQNEISEINSKIEPSPEKLFRKRDELPPFVGWLESYSDFWFSGTSLFNLLIKYQPNIVNAAQKNKHFRFLICNPEDATLFMVFSKTNAFDHSVQELQSRGRQALKMIQDMQSICPEGTIEVKVSDHFFTCSYTILDGESSNGMINFELYGYKIAIGEQFHIIFKNHKNSLTYSYHIEQFKKMWNDGNAHKIVNNVDRGKKGKITPQPSK